MSRLIIKNLPKNLTTEKLRETFSEKGVLTDVQLKYARNGKFRGFAFVGYLSEEQATAAVEHFNNTFINATRIQVEKCAELGDANKPKAWSKYSVDSSAYKNLHAVPEKKGDKIEKKKKEKDKKKADAKPIDPELLKKIKKHKDDPMFVEFMEAHAKGVAWSNDALQVLAEPALDLEDEAVGIGGEEDKAHDEPEGDNAPSMAHAAISDMEYLKLKTKLGDGDGDSTILGQPAKTEAKADEKASLLTVTVRNLPCKVRKAELKDLFRPTSTVNIRLPRAIKGLAYVSFRTQAALRQALNKNKSFLGGKQISVSEYSKKLPVETPDVANRWKVQEEALKQEENIAESGRIFVRNLSYTVTEDLIEELFTKFGPIVEVIVPVDRFTRRVKGFATITYLMPEHAVKAYEALDGTIFQGRMLHLLPGKAKETDQPGEEDTSSSFRQKRDNKLKASAGSSHNWNTLFLGHDVVAEVIADTYNTTKEKVLSGNDAAVRLALGETQIVAETRKFLEENGVKLDAFNRVADKRSKTVIIAKNLPAKTVASELREVFAKHGQLGRIVLPPSGATALIEFLEPSEARVAFTRLAYSKFKFVPLYLEWAPDDSFTTAADAQKRDTDEQDDRESGHATDKGEKEVEKVDDNDLDEAELETDTTLFIKNLNFETTEDDIKKHFKKCGQIASVTVARRKDPHRPGVQLSMGYGFVQFLRQAALQTALKTLQHSSLAGHSVELKRSNRTLQAQSHVGRKTGNVLKQTGNKILVRNIPFQAKEHEVAKLFKTFGDIKSIRLPKKLVGSGSHRGFAFVEYHTKNDAKQAMKALCQSTHFFGRRLVLEWAEPDEGIEQLRKRTAAHFHQDSAPRSKKATASLELGEEEEED